MMEKQKRKQGFGSMDPKKHEAIARMGGESVSKNREWMAEIARKGGIASGVSKRMKKQSCG